MRITPNKNSVTIENSEGNTINLSVDEVAELALNAHQILDQLTLRGPEQGKFAAVASRPIQEVSLGLDAHHSTVLIQLAFEDGSKVAYSATPELSAQLRDALTRKIEQIETAAKGRTTQ